QELLLERVRAFLIQGLVFLRCDEIRLENSAKLLAAMNLVKHRVRAKGAREVERRLAVAPAEWVGEVAEGDGEPRPERNLALQDEEEGVDEQLRDFRIGHVGEQDHLAEVLLTVLIELFRESHRGVDAESLASPVVRRQLQGGPVGAVKYLDVERLLKELLEV